MVIAIKRTPDNRIPRVATLIFNTLSWLYGNGVGRAVVFRDEEIPCRDAVAESNNTVASSVGYPRSHRQSAFVVRGPERTGRWCDGAEGVGHFTAHCEGHHAAVTPSQRENPIFVDAQRVPELVEHRPQKVHIAAAVIRPPIGTRCAVGRHEDGGAIREAFQTVILLIGDVVGASTAPVPSEYQSVGVVHIVITGDIEDVFAIQPVDIDAMPTVAKPWGRSTSRRSVAAGT